MADPCVVILNDTDVDGYHFGCARVMDVIRSQLANRNLSVAGSVAVGLNWQDAHADLVNACDLLVINGEGTLHHASRKGRWLLEAGAAVKARGGHVALINALWQDNPPDWAELIKPFDILSCRDSRSAAAMAAQTGRDVRLMGDLSMSQPVTLTQQDRAGIVFGDSVHSGITEKLSHIARRTDGAEIVPVTSSLKFISPALVGWRRNLRTWYAGAKQRRFVRKNLNARFVRMSPNARFVPDEAAYLDLIAGKALCVTGRFHAVCLAIATRTPFVATTSNSWKIEALIDDIGLEPRRIMSLDALEAADLSAGRWAFSAEETARIDSALATWHDATTTLFDDIAALPNREKRLPQLRPCSQGPDY